MNGLPDELRRPAATLNDCLRLLQPRGSAKAREILETYAERGGNTDLLFAYLRNACLVVDASSSAKAYASAQRRRDRSLARFEDTAESLPALTRYEAAARELLEFYEAPEGAHDWMAVYVGEPRDGETKPSTPVSRHHRWQHARRLRESLAAVAEASRRIQLALSGLRRDPVFRSRPAKKEAHRPLLSGPFVHDLRKLGHGISRDKARLVLSQLRRKRLGP